MKQEDRELLLRDLCGRIPYGVKVQIDLQSNIYPSISCKVCNIEFTENESAFIGVETSPDTYNEFREFLCKPYLFPLSSMTAEQKQYLKNRFYYDWNGEPYDLWKCQIEIGDADELIDWFHQNHFDHRGLIPRGLANDATGLNIY